MTAFMLWLARSRGWRLNSVVDHARTLVASHPPGRASPHQRSKSAFVKTVHGFHVALHILSVPFMKVGFSVSRYSSDRPKNRATMIFTREHAMRKVLRGYAKD
jgi:hypothetical protein